MQGSAGEIFRKPQFGVTDNDIGRVYNDQLVPLSKLQPLGKERSCGIDTTLRCCATASFPDAVLSRDVRGHVAR